MKKLFTILFSVFLFSFLLFSLPAKAQLPFSDGFESWTLDNWVASGDTNINDEFPYEGQAYFEGLDFYQMEKTFTPIAEDIITVEFAMRANQIDKECVDFLVYDDNNNTIARIYFANNGAIISKNGPQDATLMLYEESVWYLIKFVIDQSLKTYNIYLDTTLIANQFDYVNASSGSASRFYFSSSESLDSRGYVDDFSISSSAGGADREALVALYNSTDGANWTDNTNWLSSEPLGSWYGVTTDESGSVTDISMTNNNLIGVLPSQIEDLTNLTTLRLDNHEITGSIPTELYSMPSLAFVNLCNNQLSGELSPLIGTMPALESYILFNNAFDGEIPVEIGNSNTLTNLQIGDNDLSGEIPPALSNLTNLYYLSLRGNQLTGEIPTELTGLNDLEYLYLDRNQLSGEIPSEIGLLSSLADLWIDNNNFEGSIPAEIQDIYLASFYFNNNNFDVFPSQLENLGNVTGRGQYNNFTFEDLENFPIGFLYDPQNTIHLYDTTILTAGIMGTIQLPFDGNVNNSSYSWYREGQSMSTTSGNSILATESTAGTYYYSLEITNTAFPQLTLLVDSVIVIVEGGPNYSTNYDEYTVGDYLAVVDAGWDTWSGTTGGSEDALITSEYAQSANNSVKVQGSTDVIYRTGNKTSGTHQLSMEVYVPTGKVGYFNMQQTDTPGEQFSLDCELNLSGAGVLNAGGTDINFTYNHDEWTNIILIVDLDNDWATFKVSGTIIHEWQWSKMTNGNVGTVQLGCLDFFANTANGTPYFYFDDVVLSEINLSTNYDEYTVGDYLAVVDAGWDTWSGTTGGSEDALITSEYAQSANNSVKVQGSTDVIYRTGNKTSGTHQLSMEVYVPTGKVGYFNMQQTDTPGEQFSLDCELNLSGAGVLNAGGTDINFTYNHDEWTNIILIVDLDNDWATFKVSGTIIHEWQWSKMTNGNDGTAQLGCLDFFANTANGTPYFYFDDVVLSEINLSTNYDEYTVGDYLAVVDAGWDTWNSNPGTAEDALITSEFAHSVPNSVKVQGTTDVIYRTGNKTSGRHQISMEVYVPTGKVGYFNVEKTDNPGDPFGLHCNLKLSGAGVLTAAGADIDFSYNNDEWNNIILIVDLDNDWAIFKVNDIEIHQWQWSKMTDGNPGVNQLGIIDFFANTANGTPYLYLDDFVITELEAVNCENIGIAGEFNSWSSPDIAMTQDEEEPYKWTTEITLATSGDVKFRQNETWDVNWGADAFPSGTALQNGDNIPALAASYFVNFNCNTGDFVFDSQNERNALMAIYNATDGANWTDNTNWDTDEPIDTWYGVKINEDGKVDSLWIGNNNLVGSIPYEIGNLSSLITLGLSGNTLSGDLPTTIGSLSNLQRLSISQCELSGSIPSEIGNLTNLTWVALWQNDFSGDIPTTFWDLTQLEYIWLGTNANLTGSLPSTIGTLSNLKTLWIDGTSMSGGIPSGIGTLSQLQVLKLANNNMDDSLPIEIGNLALLEELDLSGNNFTGELYEFNTPNSLVNVLISGNLFDVIQPLWSAVSLDTFNVQNNQFSFEDLENLPANGIYDPQNTISLYDTTQLKAGVEGLIQLDIDNNVSGSSYNWIRNSEFIATTNGNSIIATESNAGTVYYNLEITNTTFGDFVLSVDSVIVITTECDLVVELDEIDAVTCYGNQDGHLSLLVSGGMPPFTYSWTGPDGYTSTEESIAGLAPGEYNVTVIGAEGCEEIGGPYTISEPDVLSFTETVSDILCYGDASGGIEIIASGGSPDYMYSIDGGYTYQSESLFTGLVSSEYSVFVLDANDCSSSHSVFISEPASELSFTETVSDILCHGDTSGQIEIIASGGSPDYAYSIDGGYTYQSESLFTGLVSSEYSVFVLDANDCSSSHSVFISEPASELSFTETVSDVLCNGGSTGIIEIIVDGGSPDYLYSLNENTPQSTNTFGGLSAGEYTVTVFDANNCSIEQMVVVNEPEASLSFTETVVDVLCNDDATGEIDIIATGGTSPYQYSIDDDYTYQDESLFTDLVADNYSVFVTDANDCSSNHSVLVAEPENALSFTVTVTDVLCHGDTIGEIEIIALGGTSPYEYSIDNGATYQTSPLFTGLTAGYYDLMVIDANFCTMGELVTISEPANALDFAVTITDVLCSGDASGEIGFETSGGTSPYEYSIDNGASYQTTDFFTGLTAGDYEVMVRDANLCTMGELVTINEPANALDFTITITDVLCSGDASGEIGFETSGGTSPYEYSIDNGASYQTTALFTGLAAGDYDIMVRDANLCTMGDLVTISEPANALDFTATPTDVLCSGDASGEIDIIASEGIAPYQYSIDNGVTYQTTDFFTGLIAGDYDVMVRDANLCTMGELVTINEPANVLDFTATPTDVLCNGDASGEIGIIASEGTAPYEYSIDNGATYETTALFTGLAAGDYEVMVRDANLCTMGDLVTISEPANALDFTATPTDVLCSGDASGEINIIATGGTAPYEYSIDNGATYGTTAFFTGLAAGDFEVMVRDANLCTMGDLVTISEPANALDFTATPTDVLCSGDASGEINIIASEGTAPYEYSIDNGVTYETTALFTGLAAGDYEVMVRDANLCTMGDLVTINEPANALDFTATPTDVLCNGDASGEIDIIASEGTAPYEYSIDNGVTYETTALFTGLAAGDYDIMVRDANLCIMGDLVTISEPANALDFTATPTDVLCSGDASGEIDIIASEGTAPYEYSIDNGVTYETTALFTGLAAGDYEVMVRDANLCTMGDLVTISEPANALDFTATPTDVLCSGDASGEIDIIASEGTAPYEYSIDNGVTYETTALFTGLAAGDYDVMVRDANLCTMGDLVTISEPANALDFTATPTDVLCNGDASGEIDIIASEGTAPYEYSIDNGVTYETTALFTGLAAGDYDVMVRDANLCTMGDLVTISEPANALDFTATPTDVLCNGDASGEIDIIASEGTAPYEYSIDNGATYGTTALFTGLAAGDYDIMVRDANLCTMGDLVTISEPAIALDFTTTITDVTCFGGNDGEIEITASGGSPAYEYSSDGGVSYQSSNIFAGLIAGDYTIFVRDDNLCEASQIETVGEPGALPSVSFTGLDAEYCESATPVTLTGNEAPEGSFTGDGITDNGDGTASFDPALAGVGGPFDITYSFTDVNGCSNFETQQTTVNSVAAVSFTGLDAEYCIDNGIVVLTGSEAPEGSFSGSGITDNGDGTADFDPALAGIGGPYDIIYTYTDANACASEATNQTTINDLPEVNFSGLDASYCLGDAILTLTGNQAPNGSFVGIGITDNGDGTADFDPNIAGLGGPYDITYSFTDGSNCFNSETQQTSVFDLPIVSFTGLDANYCDGDTEITITGSEAPNGSFSGSGVFDQGNGTALFYPVVAGLGSHDITYSFENGNGCIGEEIQATTVNELPIASFTGLDAAYCENATSVILTGNFAPDGGFSGPGITDNGDGTAVFDPAIAGSGGPFDISYNYTSPEGCFDDDVQQVEVYLVDELSFTSLEASYCSGVDPIIITGNLAPDGNFSGEGITDNNDGTATFDPTDAGIGGPYSILYSYTNSSGCYAESVQVTEVIETPDISFTGLEEAYCIDNGIVELTGNEPLGVYTGDGIIDNGDGTATFDPSLAGVGGPYLVSFSYTNPQGCTGEHRIEVQVYDYISVSFTGLDTEYCQFATAVIITGSEAPFGTFSGPGITDNSDGTATFDPANAGAGGPYTISYIYFDGGVCSSSFEQAVIVNPSNPVTFTGLNESFCDENYNHILIGSQAPDGYFLGQGVVNNGDGTAYFNPSIAGVGGPYVISYNYENEFGCISALELETAVIEGPTADFSYDLSACNEDAIFMDQSSSPNGLISSWAWDFDDPDSDPNNTSADQNPLHGFVSNQSSFFLELSILDEIGCSDTIIKQIEPYSLSTIEGYVLTNNGQVITDGYVLAFLLSDGLISTQEDSVQIQEDGTYVFEEMASCVDYIFHAYSNVDLFPNVVPRWHLDAFYWFDATPISVAWDDLLVEDIEISLYEIIPPEPGSSEIGGGVYYAGGKGEPVKNIDVVLEYEDPTEKGSEIIGYQPTDDFGSWNFNELTEGVYRIKIDIPGLTMDSVYTIEITQPHTIITGLNYYVDTASGIFTDYTGLGEFDQLPFGSLSVFPNPNNGSFHLDIQKSESISILDIQSVELWDMEGRLVKNFNVKYKGDRYLSNFELNDVQPGMYFIKVKNNDDIGVAKFVIQR